MPRIGVVADDITGANDIGAMLALNGYIADVFTRSHGGLSVHLNGADALIVDTDSRLDSPQQAREKTLQAVEDLRSYNPSVYFAKTCSVFRGNVGAQLDAMLESLNAQCGMVIVGFPRNGRTTLHGIHYVYGQKLEESGFRNDPIHPMCESNLLEILSKQSRYAVTSFDAAYLERSEQEAKAHLDALKAMARYVIFDVRTQEDLRTIAGLIKSEHFLCGSSAIMEELPKVWMTDAPLEERQQCLPVVSSNSRGVIILSGSLTSVTAKQTRYIEAQHIPAFVLPGEAAFSSESRQAAINDIVASCQEYLSVGMNVLIRTENSPEAIAYTQALGSANGYSAGSTGRLLSALLGEVVRLLIEKTGTRRIVVAGGETSAAVAQALGIHQMRILNEIEPGVPTMIGIAENGIIYPLVFKSGSFGSDAFLANAAECLRAIL